MRIESIEMQGFGSYRSYNTCAVPNGITGIVGQLEEIPGRSNGSGKSKAIMAIPFALFGVGTYDKMEEIWNDKLDLKDHTYVRINFELSGSKYTVERGKKSSKSYMEVKEDGKVVKDEIIKKGDK